MNPENFAKNNAGVGIGVLKIPPGVGLTMLTPANSPFRVTKTS